MTKDEAINAMKAGKKVAHRNFSADEWIGMLGETMIVTEEDYRVDAKAFWQDRKEPSWQISWRVVGDL